MPADLISKIAENIMFSIKKITNAQFNGAINNVFLFL